MSINLLYESRESTELIEQRQNRRLRLIAWIMSLVSSFGWTAWTAGNTYYYSYSRHRESMPKSVQAFVTSYFFFDLFLCGTLLSTGLWGAAQHGRKLNRSELLFFVTMAPYAVFFTIYWCGYLHHL